MRTEKRVKVMAALAGVVALLLVAATPLGHPALRLKASPSTVWDDSDPTVLVEGTHTYLFGSSNNRKVPVRQITSYSSSLATSQADWAAALRRRHAHPPRLGEPGEVADLGAVGGQDRHPVPDVLRVHNAAATTDMNNDQCIGRAVSSSPIGPVPALGRAALLRPPRRGRRRRQPPSNRYGRGALDPDVFLAHDGHLYLIVALSRTNASIGEVPLTRRRSAHRRPQLQGQHARRHQPALAGRHRQHHAHPRVVPREPVDDLRAQDEDLPALLLGGRWATAAYLTGFARCAHAYGPCTLEKSGPFLMSGNGRTGVGGLTAFVSSAGALRVAYSSWTAGHEGQSGSVGQYSRQVTWGLLSLSSGSDPATQTVTLH